MKKNRTYKVNAFLMMLLAGTLSFSAAAAASESGLQPAAAAQQQPVKGTIVDVNGNPVPGASVMIPGTTTGTVTQVDGTFSLNVAEGTKVEIGCLGYTTVSVSQIYGSTSPAGSYFCLWNPVPYLQSPSSNKCRLS